MTKRTIYISIIAVVVILVVVTAAIFICRPAPEPDTDTEPVGESVRITRGPYLQFAGDFINSGEIVLSWETTKPISGTAFLWQ